MKNKKYKKHKLSVAISIAIMPLFLGASLTAFAAEKKSEEPKSTDLQKTEDIEVIEVIGSIRASYEGAIGVKRLADTVVDAITSEDIGQFSDDSIAGAIQRMPGVQIEIDQAGTDGDRVSIRGLGPEFVNSTINGRTLLSSGNEAKGLRKMNFNVFPSSILSGVRVAKGQTAARPESGLAGQIDLQTIRPLNLKQLANKNYFGSVSYKAEYHDLANDDGGLVEGSFGWKNENNNFGFYLGLVSGKSDVTFEQFSQTRATRNLRIDNDGDGVQDELIKGVNVPNVQTTRPMKQIIEREALSAGLQWQPSDDLNIVWDITSATFDNQSQRHNGQTIMTPVWGGTVFDANGIEIDDDNVLRYADFSMANKGGPILSRVQDMKFGNKTENFISGVNFNYFSGNLTTNFDVYYSSVDYSQDLRFPIFNKKIDKSLAVYDGRGDIPTLTTGEDRLDPNGYAYIKSIVREIALDGENYGATLNFNYELDMDGFSGVDLGVHYEKTDLDSKRSLAKQFENVEKAAEIAAAAVTGELRPGEFLADENFNPETWLLSDFDAVGAIDPNVYATGMDSLGIDPVASHQSTEQILALYAQVNIASEIASLPLSGNIGLRAVYTENEATAATVGTNDTILNTTGGDYWQYLPSVNLNLAIDEDLALRLGFSKTLSRPEYSDMAPITIVQLPVCGDEESAEDCRGKAKVGNPDLDPMTSLNYDLTLEWYNDFDGSAVVSVFYKDVSDFIINDLASSQTLPGQPTDILLDITQPVNFSDGEAKGYEIGFYQPFDKLFPTLTGFGFSTNYTNVKSEFDEDVGDSGFGFPGSSENNFNFIGFYENDLFSVRLAYVYRDDFFRSLAGQGSQTTDARFTSDSEKLDLNIKLKPMKNLTLAFNASNLLGDNRRDHIGDKAKFLDYFETGKSYSLSASYRF